MPKRTGRGGRRSFGPQRARRPVRTSAAPWSSVASAADEPSASRTALARVLDAPNLARAVPHLAPETLHQLIRRCGLDACGELMASATPGQLASVLDLDLWSGAAPGRDEQFAEDRFGEWLEALVDYGATEAARILAMLDLRLVVVGLSRYIRVVDLATFEPIAHSDDEPMTRDGRWGGPECEIGSCAIQGRRPDAWDAILAILQALETTHPAAFRDVMRGCRQLSDAGRELDGLDDLMAAPDQWLHDVAMERERRRVSQGYSTAAAARAFLELARQRGGTARQSRNPIAAAYFRAADEMTVVAAGDRSDAAGRLAGATPIDLPVAKDVAGVIELLVEAGVVPDRPRARLAEPSTTPRFACIQPLMEQVRDRDEGRYYACMQELAFLTNTVMAGCAVQNRMLTPREASDAAVAICNLGLDVWPARWPEGRVESRSSSQELVGKLPADFLVDHDLVTAFEAGWATLYEDVCLFVAKQLAQTLTDLRCADADLLLGLHRLRTELRMAIERGTPWQACDRLDVLAILDTPAWIGLLGLLNECPVLPDAAAAIVSGRAGAVSATAFEFISTTSQLRVVRTFMARLPGALGP